ncbi:MAG: hypothetical protein QOI10_1315 [Solirubrobacterales bacterium]|nr:hypothetical protein [Solirubrobacterales bacterium]
MRVLGAVGVLTALTVVGAGGSASAAKTSAKPGVTKIKIEVSHAEHSLFFDGPSTVARGDQLQIKNNTNPRTIGPHTFSLTTENVRPEGTNQQKACGKKLKGICGAVAIGWHEVDLQTGQIGVNPVEVGKKGWDTKGNLKRKGDSVVMTGKGEKFSQKVTAPVGTTLYYMCVVHPEMQGEIEVVAGS